MEDFIQILIFTHITLGSIAFLTGFIAVITKKGKSSHRYSGLAFYYTMLLSVLISLAISLLPNHTNSFLFCIGLFSSYFIIMGKRAIQYKQITKATQLDFILILSMFSTGVFMVFQQLIDKKEFNLVLFVFGIFTIFFAINDWRLLRDFEQLKRNYLTLHLSRIIGGYIAAVTAFLVVNDLFPYHLNWFAPSIIGGFYITFWSRKLNKSKRNVSILS